MSDYISRKAAIDETWKEPSYTDPYNVLTEVRERIQSLPSTQPELLAHGEGELSAQPEPQWIPCSERLPKANGRYYVTRGLNACGALWNRVYIVNYSDLMGLKSERIWWDGNVGKSDFKRIDDVIAWMPLPKPYKGEEL